MSFVTDEMVEAAARAMCEAWHYAPIGTPDGNAEWRGKQTQYRKQARAALTAAAPLWLAKVRAASEHTADYQIAEACRAALSRIRETTDV